MGAAAQHRPANHNIGEGGIGAILQRGSIRTGALLQNDHHMGTVERINSPKPCECPKTISPKEIREIGEFEIAGGFVSSMTARDLEESFNTEGDVNARLNGRMNMGKAARRQMRTYKVNVTVP